MTKLLENEHLRSRRKVARGSYGCRRCPSRPSGNWLCGKPCRCCKSRDKAYNRNMTYTSHIATIAELAESEGVFTTAQAARMGISRDALHDAVVSGRLERVVHGAYRMVGSGSSPNNELVAIWKMTKPSAYSHERMQISSWDGVAIGGSTAATLLGLGDFYLSPYRIYAPRRFNSRNKAAHFSVRPISRDEVTFVSGLPVTSPERTIFDLVVDGEDGSLVADALRDASREGSGFDFAKLKSLLQSKYVPKRATSIYESLLADAGIVAEGVGA